MKKREKEITNEVSSIQKEKKDSEDNLKILEDAKSQMESQCQEIKKQVDALNGEMQNKQQEFEQKQKAAEKESNEKLDTMEQEKIRELSDLNRKVEAFRQEKQNLEEKLRQLNQQLESKDPNAAMFQQEALQAKQEKEKLEMDLHNLNKQITESAKEFEKKSRDEKEKFQKDQENLKNQWEQEKKELKAKEDSQKTQLQKIQDQLNEKNKAKESVEYQLQLKENELVLLQQKLEEIGKAQPIQEKDILIEVNTLRLETIQDSRAFIEGMIGEIQSGEFPLKIGDKIDHKIIDEDLFKKTSTDLFKQSNLPKKDLGQLKKIKEKIVSIETQLTNKKKEEMDQSEVENFKKTTLELFKFLGVQKKPVSFVSVLEVEKIDDNDTLRSCIESIIEACDNAKQFIYTVARITNTPLIKKILLDYSIFSDRQIFEIIQTEDQQKNVKVAFDFENMNQDTTADDPNGSTQYKKSQRAIDGIFKVIKSKIDHYPFTKKNMQADIQQYIYNSNNIKTKLLNEIEPKYKERIEKIFQIIESSFKSFTDAEIQEFVTNKPLTSTTLQAIINYIYKIRYNIENGFEVMIHTGLSPQEFSEKIYPLIYEINHNELATCLEKIIYRSEYNLQYNKDHLMKIEYEYKSFKYAHGTVSNLGESTADQLIQFYQNDDTDYILNDICLSFRYNPFNDNETRKTKDPQKFHFYTNKDKKFYLYSEYSDQRPNLPYEFSIFDNKNNLNGFFK